MLCLLVASFKLLAEILPWQAGSSFAYLLDNHNSVLGMREIAIERGASAAACRLTGGHSGDGMDCSLMPAACMGCFL